MVGGGECPYRLRDLLLDRHPGIVLFERVAFPVCTLS